MPDSEFGDLWGVVADGVLALHAAVAAFVVLGQLVIMAGGVARWTFVRELWLRAAHMALIVFIAAQTLLGQTCPLTRLEMALRLWAGQPVYEETFTQHWLSHAIYFTASPSVFIALHTVAALVVIATWFLVPPDWSGMRGGRQGGADAVEL